VLGERMGIHGHLFKTLWPPRWASRERLPATPPAGYLCAERRQKCRANGGWAVWAMTPWESQGPAGFNRPGLLGVTKDVSTRRGVTAPAARRKKGQRLVVHAVISSVSIVDFDGLHPQPAAGPTAGPDRRNARTRLPPPAPQGRKNQ